MPWAFPFLALKRFVCILDKPCLQADISSSAFADKPCLHNCGRLRVPWTFPPPTSEIADESADKFADKVCLDMCLTNLFKNADARAAKIVQNADKSCLPKLQTKFVYSRQGLSILELALNQLRYVTLVAAQFPLKLESVRTSGRIFLSRKTRFNTHHFDADLAIFSEAGLECGCPPILRACAEPPETANLRERYFCGAAIQSQASKQGTA